MADETAVFNLNTTNVMMKQAAKHIIIVLRRPIALAIQPETMLPPKPEIANIIMVNPRRSFARASLPEILCIHVGAHGKRTAHKPISMAPNIH